MHYDMEDLIEQANEIQESLGRSYYVADEVDEADLQAELDALGLDDELVGENETPSYLQDSAALPDFVDAAPVEEEVSRASERGLQGSEPEVWSSSQAAAISIAAER